MEKLSGPMDDGLVLCLMRVGTNYDWLRLYENTEVTLGRGEDNSYQLLSPTFPLMISRLHCTLKQSEDGRLTVTDQKSLNGVWVNGVRLQAAEPHALQIGDSLKLGVPLKESGVEFAYELIRRPLADIKHNLAKEPMGFVRVPQAVKANKRMLPLMEVEASTSMPKLYRTSSSADKTLAQPCPLTVEHHELSDAPREETDTRREVLEADRAGGSEALDNLQIFSQNIVLLKQQVSSTQKMVASMKKGPQQDNPVREKQVTELQKQLAILQAKMEALEKYFANMKRQQEEQKTQQQEELLKKQLEEALQEQRKLMEELAHSRQGFEEILWAINKELEMKEEKARAQKEEVLNQMNDVLENELQCIICSEFFIEAVTLNCAHCFCSYCINQWQMKKEDCPMCRRPILSQSRCLALDNCIDGIVENLSPGMKSRRQTLIAERKELGAAELGAAKLGVTVPTVILDDSSSSSSGLLSTESSLNDAFLSRDLDSSFSIKDSSYTD